MSRVALHITSRENALLVGLRKLVKDPAGYRKAGSVWLEGEHLCAAAVTRGRLAAQAVVTERVWADPTLRVLAENAERIAIVSDALFESVSGLESHGGIGFLVKHADGSEIRPGVPSVLLDRLQDAGNVGSILRSASALGVTQVIAFKGTAAIWSPKVLRAGMGAHFGLHIVEGFGANEVGAVQLALAIPLVATSSHAGASLVNASLPDPCAWVFGHEGRGVSDELMSRCELQLRIPQPGGEESLNVASAAAICLYESLRQRSLANC